MKQPQLGKTIVKLRLAKGLTQNELAEKCNISLRTIQRIESTEVTPRSYTLKLIFNSLDYDGYNTSPKTPNQTSLQKLNLNNNTKAWILAVSIVFILGLSYLSLPLLKKSQSNEEITTYIHKAQSKITTWINNKQLDSVLTMYHENACVLNNKCGKAQIRSMMQDIVSNDYQILDYTTTSISISNSIAVEKYKSIYRYKGKTHQQIGLIEWRRINKKWLINNDMFRDN